VKRNRLLDLMRGVLTADDAKSGQAVGENVFDIDNCDITAERFLIRPVDFFKHTDMVKFPHGGMLCLLGPYGDFFIDVLAEILTTFPDVDAFSFDGLHYGGVCYCEHCRKNYRDETGADIPDADLNDPAFCKYQHWADRRMEDLVRRMQNRLKGIKPEVALVTWTTNAGRFGHFLCVPRNMPARMNLLLDAPDQEFWLEESNRGTTIVPAFANAYVWAVTTIGRSARTSLIFVRIRNRG